MQCIRTTFPPSSPIFFLPHILSSSSPPSLLFTPLPPNIPSSLSHSHSGFLSPLSLSSFFSSPATAPLTSHYNFSLYDETSFDADLLLSNGELHSEMLRTEFCLQGRAYYNINILTVSTKVTIGIPIGQEFKTLDYIHLDCLLIAHIPASPPFPKHIHQGFTQNLTAHQFQRYSATVGNLQQGFQTSYQQLVASEAGYSGLRGNLHTALNDIPSRYDGVATLLDRYKMEANQIASEFELKSRAQMVFSAIIPLACPCVIRWRWLCVWDQD